jgi:hypothetical protein
MKSLRVVLAIVLMTFTQLCLAQNSFDISLTCLFGANPEDDEIKGFISEHKLIEMNELVPMSRHPIGYKVENGLITTLFFSTTAYIPSYFATKFRLYSSYRYLSEIESQLEKPNKIKDRSVEYTQGLGNVVCRSIYIRNYGTKKDLDFTLAGVEIRHNHPSEKLIKNCDELVIKPNLFCFQGNCLACFINHPIKDVMDELKQKWNLPFSEGTRYFEQHYGSSAYGMEVYEDKKGLVDKIELYVNNYNEELPLGLTKDISREELCNQLGLYRLDKNSWHFYFNYGKVVFYITFDYNTGKLTNIRLSRASGNETPICEINNPQELPVYGCLSGDCGHGYGRARFNGETILSWEYEGYFENKLPHGDGCRIIDKRYSCHNFIAGQAKGSVKEKICVDDWCQEPEEKKEVDVDDNDDWWGSHDVKNNDQEKKVEEYLTKHANDVKEQMYRDGWRMVENYQYHTTNSKPDNWLEKRFYATKGYKHKIVIIVPSYCNTLDCKHVDAEGRAGDKVNHADFSGQTVMQVIHYDFTANSSGNYIFKYKFGALNTKIDYRLMYFREPF